MTDDDTLRRLGIELPVPMPRGLDLPAVRADPSLITGSAAISTSTRPARRPGSPAWLMLAVRSAEPGGLERAVRVVTLLGMADHDRVRHVLRAAYRQ